MISFFYLRFICLFHVTYFQMSIDSWLFAFIDEDPCWSKLLARMHFLYPSEQLFLLAVNTNIELDYSSCSSSSWMCGGGVCVCVSIGERRGHMTRLWNFFDFWAGSPCLWEHFHFFLAPLPTLLIFNCRISSLKPIAWLYPQGRTNSELLCSSTNYLARGPLTIPFHNHSALIMMEVILGFCY